MIMVTVLLVSNDILIVVVIILWLTLLLLLVGIIPLMSTRLRGDKHVTDLRSGPVLCLVI